MDAACNEMKRATIIRLLEEAEARVGAAEDLLRENGKTRLANLAYTVEGKIQRLTDIVRDDY